MRRIKEDRPVPHIERGLGGLLVFYVLCLGQMIYTLLMAIPVRLHVLHVSVPGPCCKPGYGTADFHRAAFNPMSPHGFKRLPRF